MVVTTHAQSPAIPSVATVTTVNAVSIDCRMQLCYHDEELRRRTQAKTLDVFHTAVKSNNSTSPTNALLAWKALKYRKLLHRVSNVDVADPSFDASRFLGVQWRKREGISG